MHAPDPRFDRPTACSHCESDQAVEGHLCVECAIHLAVDNDESSSAHEIAERHGLSREYVTGVIRECEIDARTMHREQIAAARAA
jgi:hypothetical protein